jgi:hypothetical protein
MKNQNVVRPYDLRVTLALSTIICFTLWLSGCTRDNQLAQSRSEPPTADLVLKQMSDKLANAKRITFKVRREFQAASSEGETDDAKTDIDVAIGRPDKLLARSKGALGSRALYADGKTFSVVDQTMKLYATLPAVGEAIDDLVVRIEARYGFTPPLSEFMLNDPYKKMSKQIQNSSYKGTEVIDGVECHHIAAQGEFADAELWVAVTDQLPRRLIATFKQREGAPQLRADFSDWNLNASLEDKIFSFVPASDDVEIQMLPMEALKADPKFNKPVSTSK